MKNNCMMSTFMVAWWPHIVSNILVTIGSYNDMWPIRQQAITSIKANCELDSWEKERHEIWS